MTAPRSDVVVVVVDDDPRLLQLWVRFFQLLDCGVITAANVPEAKAIVAAHDVDILITDLNMPGTSGVALLEWLLGVSTGDMKVYVASGYHDQFAMELGGYRVERCIAKPFHFKEELAYFRGVLDALAERR